MAWTLAQTAVFYDTGGASGSSNTVTYGSALTPGSLLIAFAQISANTTATFSDGSNTWATAVSKFGSGTGQLIAIGYAINASSSALTVTVTYGASNVFRAGGILEFTGNASSSVLDVASVGAAAATTPPTDASMTTTVSGDLIVNAICDDNLNGSGMTAGSGFTLKGNTTATIALQYKTQSSSGAIACAYGGSGYGSWAVCSAAFKPSAGGGGGSRSLLAPVVQPYAVHRASNW